MTSTVDIGNRASRPDHTETADRVGTQRAELRDAVAAPCASFVTRAWYVAALASEVGDGLLARTILGRSVVLYRAADGTPVALHDRCSHRGFPLSAGTRSGDSVQCGYHGFTFDCAGTCISVPGQSAIPRRASVRAFPAVERGPFVWVWLGDDDPSGVDVPGGSTLTDEGWTFVSGYVSIACHQALLIDNLMDLSHETYIHATKIGTPEVAETPITTTVDADAHVVYASRHMDGVTSPPSYAELGLQTPVDRWQDMEFRAPSLYVLYSRVAPAGTPPEQDAETNAVHVRIVYGLTPADGTSTHYFFAIGRDFALDDDGLSRAMERGQYDLIAEDAAAVELLQHVNDAEGPVPEVSIKIDTAALASRRIVTSLLTEAV
jgi:phenylpropionate dioxygenase-like ring-hydroxylating dioxygenase large terminal subunit